MTEKHSALEPSFADAITAISTAADLSEETRRHWRSSLTGIARAFDQPPELIPARYSAIRARMAGLHHLPLDWVAKTRFTAVADIMLAADLAAVGIAPDTYGLAKSPDRAIILGMPA